MLRAQRAGKKKKKSGGWFVPTMASKSPLEICGQLCRLLPLLSRAILFKGGLTPPLSTTSTRLKAASSFLQWWDEPVSQLSATSRPCSLLGIQSTFAIAFTTQKYSRTDKCLTLNWLIKWQYGRLTCN